MVGIEVENESEEVSSSLKVEKVLDVNEKSDSGMDDDSVKTDSPEKVDLDSDSEDEIIVVKKQKRKVILEDSDEDEEEDSKKEDDVQKPVEEKFIKNKSAEDVLDEAMNDDENSEQESDNLENEILGSNPESQDTKKTQPPKAMFGDSDIYDAEESSDDEKQEKKKSSHKDNSSDSSDSNDSDSNDEGREVHGDDEGFDESTIDPKLLAKLKKFKGAGKTATREGKKRKAKEDALNIHSESQRLVRESHINLPYHQPTPKSLNDFLARASKKQEQYKCLRSVRDNRNAMVIEETLSEKKEKSPKKLTPSREKKSSSSDEKDESKKDLNDESSRTYLFDTLCNLKNTENESGDELPDITPRDLNKDFSNLEKADGDTEAASADNAGAKNPAESQMDSESILEIDMCKGNEQGSKVQNDVEFSSKCLDDDSENISEKCSNDKTLLLDSEKNSESKSLDTLDSTQTPKQKILSRLNLSIEEKPRLSGTPDDFIDFDSEANTPKNPEMNKFMDRFLKHSKKKTHKKAKDVDISIVQKESIGGDKEELKLNSFTYHIDDDDDDDTDCKKTEDVPGAKLLTLKEKLEAAMKVKREVSRQKREEMYNLENEEGFEEEEDNILDNEEELTDGSDTDIEDDDFDKQFGNEEYDDEEQEKVENPFADDEAEEEEEKEEDDDDEGTMKLQLDTSDEEDEEIKKPSKSQRVVISDDEESRDTVHTNTDKGCEEEEMDINNDINNDNEDELSPLSKHLKSNTPKISRIGSLTLPIEDTQDLYNDTQDGFNSSNYPVSDTQPSQSLNYLLEDSQSQMLDADGFLKVRSTQPTRRSLGLEDCSNQTQDNMEELLGLCSGRFVESSSIDKKKKLFNNNNNNVSTQDGDMDELVGLCSGVFATAKSQDMKKKQNESSSIDKKKKLFNNNNVSTQDGDMDELVGLCSGVFATAKSQGLKRKLEDDDDDNDNDDDEESTNLLLSEDEDEATQKVEYNESSSDDEAPNIIIKQKKKKGFKTRDGKIRADFVDEEAELSGSECESDENLDLDEEEDILMVEEGDKDNTVTDTELRDQVGRAHLKQVIDEDKREIVRLKEMYLPDGDLHSDGAGRMRRFRWSNIDEGSQQDMFGNDSDGGEEGADENEATEELKWRMERHEREKFLEEQKENEEKESMVMEREDSQILKFGKCFLQKKDPNKTTLQRSVSLPVTSNQTESDSTFIKPSLKSSKRGSFLNRSKKDLAKIADRTKSKMNPNQTSHSRNFVFQVISPDKNKTESAVTVTKTTASSKVKKPPNKKQKLDTKKNTKSQNSSLFKLLEN